MDRLRRKLTYSNLVSTLCLFLLLGGGTAFAAAHLGKNSVGSRQLKKNAVTAAKLKAGAVTGAKLAAGAVGGSAIAPGAITADKLAPGVIPVDKPGVAGPPSAPAPAPAAPELVKGASGTLQLGMEAPIFTYGPFTITARCVEATRVKNTGVEAQFLISSSTAHSVFATLGGGSEDLGPETPAEERIVGGTALLQNQDPYQSQGPADDSVSASSTAGLAFNAFIGQANDDASGTCWYWLTANVIS